LEGFWPSNNWRAYYELTSIPTIVDVDPEDRVIFPYCGPRSMHPFFSIVAYTPFHDLFVGNFVLVRLGNPKLYHVWMGNVESDVVRD